MVAIILVNYNGVTDTIECVKSLNNIVDKEFEVIVVDNCSTDNSYIELDKLKDVYGYTLLQAETNNGFSAGNNIGIKYAKDADYFLLLNNDTVVEPDFLSKLLTQLEMNPSAGAATSKILYYSQPNKVWYAGGSFSAKNARSEHFRYNQIDNSEEKISSVSFASGCCLCISKEAINSIGLLNEDFFLYEEDAELCYRLIQAGYKIIYVPDSVIYHKVSASTGAGSPMSQFYSVRNKYYLIQLHFKGINRMRAYLYCTAQFFFRCLKGEMNFKYFITGFKAFFKGEMGKM